MRRKICSILLVLSLLCALLPSAAAEEVVPGPPPWVPETEYAVFPGSAVYQSENWALIETLRADAAAGELRPTSGGRTSMYQVYAAASALPEDAGTCFELGLIEMKYALNGGTTSQYNLTSSLFTQADSLTAETGGQPNVMAQLWSTRLQIRAGYASSSADAVVQLMSDSDFTLDQILDCDIVRTAGEEVVAELRQYLAEHSIMPIRDSINVALDGGTIIHQSSDPRVAAHARDGRTMVPLRAVVTKLGADVEWEQATQGITITRAGKTVHMTLGSAVATVDGQSVQMDVAPYANDGTTFIPVRYVAEFFGQKVEWDQKSRTVSITEDRSVVGDSNLEQWALPMGAMLSYMHGGNGLMTSMVTNFGVERRGDGSCAEGRRILNSPSWGIMGREDLVAAVASMTFYGHNSSFLSDVAMIDAMPQEQYEKIISENTGMDRYMFPYTKALGEKWGDRGILCWDLFRMSNLVQWGYQAGYLTYAEALALLEPAAVLLQTNFSSWDEAYENYLDGYNWWARNNVLGQNIWETERGVYYTEMKEAPNIAPIFDDSLFDQGVIPVEGMDFASLVEEVLG